jgi:hypothetical protein
MHLITELFILGAILVLASFVFQFVITALIAVVILPLVGLRWLVAKLRD